MLIVTAAKNGTVRSQDVTNSGMGLFGLVCACLLVGFLVLWVWFCFFKNGEVS